MKMLIRKIVCLPFLLCTLAFTSGCENQSTELVNTQTINIENTKKLEIDYSSENITVYESNDNNLVLKEYMSENKQEYYAKINSSGEKITIDSGNRPLFINSYVEVYLPKSFDGDLSLKTASGKLTITSNYNFGILNIKTSSGDVEINDVATNESKIETSSGAVNITKISGNLWVATSSGKIEIGDAIGSGYFSTSSGTIKPSFSYINGDITCKSSSGKIQLGIPSKLSFKFKSNTSSGAINVPFEGNEVGSSPDLKIDLSTSSGAIEVFYR